MKLSIPFVKGIHLTLLRNSTLYKFKVESNSL